MFILEMSNNPVYRLTGTLFEIMESLQSLTLHNVRQMDMSLILKRYGLQTLPMWMKIMNILNL